MNGVSHSFCRGSHVFCLLAGAWGFASRYARLLRPHRSPADAGLPLPHLCRPCGTQVPRSCRPQTTLQLPIYHRLTTMVKSRLRRGNINARSARLTTILRNS